MHRVPPLVLRGVVQKSRDDSVSWRQGADAFVAFGQRLNRGDGVRVQVKDPPAWAPVSTAAWYNAVYRGQRDERYGFQGVLLGLSLTAYVLPADAVRYKVTVHRR